MTGRIPAPLVTCSDTDGELCFEWWAANGWKYTLYAHPGDVLRVDQNGNAEDTTVADLLSWLRQGHGK